MEIIDNYNLRRFFFIEFVIGADDAIKINKKIYNIFFYCISKKKRDGDVKKSILKEYINNSGLILLFFALFFF